VPEAISQLKDGDHQKLDDPSSALINNRKADNGIATFRYFSPLKNQASLKRSRTSVVQKMSYSKNFHLQNSQRSFRSKSLQSETQGT